MRGSGESFFQKGCGEDKGTRWHVRQDTTLSNILRIYWIYFILPSQVYIEEKRKRRRTKPDKAIRKRRGRGRRLILRPIPQQKQRQEQQPK